MALAQVTSIMFSTAEIHILFEGQKTRFSYPGISWKKRHQFFRLFLLQVSLTEKCVWKDTNDHTVDLSVFSHVVYWFVFFFFSVVGYQLDLSERAANKSKPK